MENLFVAVFNAQSFASCHRVSSYVFAVIPEHILNVVYHAALDTGYICDDCATLEVLLVIPYPLLENMRIQGEYYHIRRAYQIGISLCASLIYYIVCQSVLDGFPVRIYGVNLKSLFSQSLGVAAADNSQTDD